MSLLAFTDDTDASAQLNTRIVHVSIAATGATVGTVLWQRKGYVFLPAPGSYYTARVLAELELFIRSLMDQWARDNGRTPLDVQTRRVKRRRLNAAI
jgi:hypothetical protein